MNLYRLLLDKNSHQVLDCSKIPDDHKDGIDYIISRGIFYYNFDNVIVNMDYDFDNPNEYDNKGYISNISNYDSNPLQKEINRNIYNNALVFIRNLKLEDLDI